jgi:hypothetical protein
VRVLIRIEGWPVMRWQFQFEPAVWIGLAKTILYVSGLFGWWGVDAWSDAQKAGAVMLVEAVAGAIQRSFVTPNASLTKATVEAAKDVPPNDPV